MGLAVVACGTIGTDLNEIIAIEPGIPDSGQMERGDTLVPHARALNGSGDSVGAVVYWDDLDTGIVKIVDSVTGATVGLKPGTAQIQARVGNLRSDPLLITVLATADTIFADSTTTDSVTVSEKLDSLSDTLRVLVQTFPDTGPPQPLSGRRVIFQILYPTDTTAMVLFPRDSAGGLDTAATDFNGVALVQVRVRNRALPDSAIVQATATRLHGQPVHGAPVTFVVRFYP